METIKMIQPILASTLYQAVKSQPAAKTELCFALNHKGIDEALQGGFKDRKITCISGERGTGKTLDNAAISIRLMIILHVIVTHLLSNPRSQAALVDTTGGFDVLRLHTIIMARILSQRADNRAAAMNTLDPKIFHSGKEIESVDAAAVRALDRVKVMRVFDFVGVSEAMDELRDSIRIALKDKQLATAWATEPTQKPHIADSQAEDGDEDVMHSDERSDKELAKTILDPVRLVIIDDITNVVNPLLKTDYVQGQALLTTFMRSLSFFTVDSNLATVLINSAPSPWKTHPSFPKLAELNRNISLPLSTYVADPLAPAALNLADQPSIFASTTARPSLGKAFSSLVDHHVLLSMIPKRRKDAEIYVGGKTGTPETVHVLEVLSDRDGDGVGRWAAFEIAGAGTRLQAPQ